MEDQNEKETVKSDMETLGISEELAMDRAGWRRVISKSNPMREEKSRLYTKIIKVRGCLYGGVGQ